MKKEDLQPGQDVTIIDKEELIVLLKEKDLFSNDSTREYIAEELSGVTGTFIELKNNTITFKVHDQGYFLPLEAIK